MSPCSCGDRGNGELVLDGLHTWLLNLPRTMERVKVLDEYVKMARASVVQLSERICKFFA